MKVISRIRFNPMTKEVEVEGSEAFVKKMFNKIQEIMSGAPAKIMKETVRPLKKAKKTLKAVKQHEGVKRVIKAQKKTPKKTLFNTVVGHIQNSKGVTTSELKANTGLSARQIWAITGKAEKIGKIKIAKHGFYEAAA